MSTDNTDIKNKKQLIISARYAIGSFILAILAPYLPVLISRHWDWWEAWALAIICNSVFVISRWMAAKRHPDILIERGHMLEQEDAKSWDKYLVPLWIVTFDLILVVAGFDKLYGWSPPFGLPVVILSLIVFLAGYIFGSYALVENRFFSGMNRIQTDRGHQVVSSGPYRWVRHPGYSGSIIAYLAIPFILGSWWACIPALLVSIVGILRTRLEDTMLQNELAGYCDYAQHVRYRLIPGVW